MLNEADNTETCYMIVTFAVVAKHFSKTNNCNYHSKHIVRPSKTQSGTTWRRVVKVLRRQAIPAARVAQ